MAQSFVSGTFTGSSNIINIPFGYLDKSQVAVTLDGVLTTAYTWNSDSQIQLSASAASLNGKKYLAQRTTPEGLLVDFQPGNIDANDLNFSLLQVIYVAQEARDRVSQNVAALEGIPGRTIQTVGVTAGELPVYDALGNLVGSDYTVGAIEALVASASGGVAFRFNTKAAAELAAIPTSIQSIVLASGVTSGDGRGGTYFRTGLLVAPTWTPADEYVRTADGAYWRRYADLNSRPIVILARGQSNMANRDAFNWEPPANLKRFNNAIEPTMTSVGTAFAPINGTVSGVAEGFAARVAWANPHRMVYLIVVAYPGLAIANWLAPDFGGKVDMFAATVNNFNAALPIIGSSYELIDLWWQGEQDYLRPTNDYWVDHITMTTRMQTTGFYPKDTTKVIFGVSPVIEDKSNPGTSEAATLKKFWELNDTLARVAAWYRNGHYIDPSDFDDISGWTPVGTTLNYFHMTGPNYFKYGGHAWEQVMKHLGGAMNRGMYANPRSGALKLPSLEAWNVGAGATLVGPNYVPTWTDQQLGRVNAKFEAVVAGGEVIVHASGAYNVGVTVRNPITNAPTWVEVHKNGVAMRPLTFKVSPDSHNSMYMPVDLKEGDRLKVYIVSGTAGSSVTPSLTYAVDFFGHFIG